MTRHVRLTDSLGTEYQTLFDSCVIAPARAAEIESTTTKIAANQARYESVGEPLDIPWFFIGVTHCMEGGLNFKTHLHNGDPLTARTVQVPKGRPKKGNPPFTWEESATDALTLEGFAGLDDWSLTSILYRFEKYNGFGYRSRKINSPYLWSFSSHYTRGKFGADGVFSPALVSKQCGAAVLLRQLVSRNAIQFNS
jgi:lysozyme family protein